MNVILCENIDNLGEMGQQVDVKDGYARNFLIPRKLAVQADSATARQIEHELAIIKRRQEKQRAQMTSIADKMRNITLEFQMRAGEEDKIFGSVTTTMIADQLIQQGFDVTRKQILLDEPIKALGIYAVTVRLFPGIEAPIKVWVTGLNDEISTSADSEADTATDETAPAEEA